MITPLPISDVDVHVAHRVDRQQVLDRPEPPGLAPAASRDFILNSRQEGDCRAVGHGI